MKLLMYCSRPAVVEMRFGLEIKLLRFAVETKFIKLAVETKLVRLGVEMKGRIEEASSAGSIKLLMYCSRPAVVEMRFGLEIKFKRF
jgi:hypothetical protein